MDAATLSARVEDYLDYEGLGTKILNWMNDTRRDLALKYDFNYLYEEATLETEANTANYALPTDYLGHLTVFIESKKLERVGAREFDSLGESDADATGFFASIPTEDTMSDTNTTGAPDYYIDRGMEIQLYPTPDAEYTLKLKYYAQPPEWNTTNYVDVGAAEDYMSIFHPEAIIFGTALRGALYLDDEAKKQNYGAAYDAAIKEMVQREKEKNARDKRPRMKTWKDFDFDTFKRMVRMNT